MLGNPLRDRAGDRVVRLQEARHRDQDRRPPDAVGKPGLAHGPGVAAGEDDVPGVRVHMQRHPDDLGVGRAEPVGEDAEARVIALGGDDPHEVAPARVVHAEREIAQDAAPGALVVDREAKLAGELPRRAGDRVHPFGLNRAAGDGHDLMGAGLVEARARRAAAARAQTPCAIGCDNRRESAHGTGGRSRLPRAPPRPARPRAPPVSRRAAPHTERESAGSRDTAGSAGSRASPVRRRALVRWPSVSGRQDLCGARYSSQRTRPCSTSARNLR